ncbi:DUF1161 domain-containing protein [Hydrogenophaga sp.]|uniref:DUF1161 domain-containing protein n=1 Tax=Hydrogenophaga sp. TaxID=1904254 RepID=UPI002610827E|nr:DUF1161 domain-containing protein [Hydrogenophaga sp.]MDM7948512.1 DUF1161 domain-containing protein [Hydrogenophaga sp.]
MLFRYRILPVLVLLAQVGAAHADNCEPIRARIEAQIRDAGVARFSVTVVPNDMPVTGEVVGSCGNGKQKIVYTRGVGADVPAIPSPLTAQPAPVGSPPQVRPVRRPTPETEILTECRDGSVSRGGSCPSAAR